MPTSPIRLRSRPGVKRDGTRLEGDHYIDAQWCRWQRGLVRKMGGYTSVVRDLPERVYGMHSFSANGLNYLHFGSSSQLQQRILNSMGSAVGSNDRTPPALVSDPDNVWTMDVFFDVNLGNLLVAHAAPNMTLSSQTDRAIFSGGVIAAGTLATSSQDSVSGGIITVGNYLVGYGNDGLVQWSAQNNIATGTLDSDNVTQQKIVTAKRVRGGGVPAALLWSLDSLVQMTFNDPATSLWDFDIVTEETSILSSRGVIEYDGTFYWPGVDRFLAYNGVVREVPNQLNVNHFFDNLNFAQRQKVFAYKVPRFGEIWWCYPRGSATECTHAIVLNVREGTWYDTVLPNQGRTDGLYPKVYFKPFMVGAEETIDGFDLWQHETGMNRVRLASTEPVPAHFETHEISVVDADEGAQNKSLRIELVEPDFVQVGDLSMTVRGRANARAAVYDDSPKTITAAAANADEQVIRLKQNRRLLSVKFESNTIDGDFQMGDILAHIEPTDERVTQ